MTLYSSDERRKPRCAVRSSYSRPSECGSAWAASTSSLPPAKRPARCEVRSPRPSSTRTSHGSMPDANVADAACATWCGDPADHRRVEAGQARAQEQRRPPRVQRAKALPLGGRDVAVDLRREVGVVRVRDRVEVGRLEPRLGQAERHRLLGQLPGRERHGRLAVLAAREALLLGGGDDLAVDDERGGRIVEDGIDSEDRGHGVAVTPLREALRSGGRSSPRSVGPRHRATRRQAAPPGPAHRPCPSTTHGSLDGSSVIAACLEHHDEEKDHEHDRAERQQTEQGEARDHPLEREPLEVQSQWGVVAHVECVRRRFAPERL